MFEPQDTKAHLEYVKILITSENHRKILDILKSKGYTFHKDIGRDVNTYKLKDSEEELIYLSSTLYKDILIDSQVSEGSKSKYDRIAGIS